MRLKSFSDSIQPINEAKMPSAAEKVLLKLGFEKFEFANAKVEESDEFYEITFDRNLSFPPPFVERIGKANITITYFSGKLSMLLPK